MFKFLKYLRRYWWQILLLLAGLSIQVWASLQLPDRMADIVNRGIVAGDEAVIWQEGLGMIGVTLIGGLGMVVAGFFASRVGTGLARDLRADIFAKVMSYSIAEIDKFSTSSLINRTTNDVTQMQQATVMVLRMSAQAPIMGIGAIVKALETAPNMTWIIALAVAALTGVVIVVLTVIMPKFKLRQVMMDKLNLVTRENLTGLRVVRAFNNERHEEEKFDAVNTPLTILNRSIDRAMTLMMPIVQLVLNFTILAVVWVGSHYIYDGVVEIGNMMAFMQYAMQVMMAFMFLVMAFVVVPRAMVSWRRIKDVLTTENSIQPATNPVSPATGERGRIEFRHVDFRYPDAEISVLSDVSFTATAGQTTAFIGSTGSGKSTLINLVPRFYDATEGQVLVDGVDVRDYAQAELMSKFGIVPQKGVLFSGTVESNLALGLEGKSDPKRIRRAARIAQAEDFIEKLDGKYQAHIAQGGTNVSGGQKQRLSIARAIARNPEIYIFDDSFSALDFKTDAKLRAELTKITSQACVLIVAQRVGTIKHADQIIVLDQGKIVGKGTHYQLLKSCKVYREIAQSQFSESEFRAELRQTGRPTTSRKAGK
jgi:ATP-binding cassette subfamily B protein